MQVIFQEKYNISAKDVIAIISELNKSLAVSIAKEHKLFDSSYILDAKYPLFFERTIL